MSPPPAPMLSTTPIAYNWSGFYIGAHGGWGFGDGAFDDGFVVGGQLGVNWQFNNFVLGAEGDGSFADWGEHEAVGTVRLRGGFALRPLPAVRHRRRGASATIVGWMAGGGVEYALTDNSRRRRRVSPLRFRQRLLRCHPRPREHHASTASSAGSLRQLEPAERPGQAGPFFLRGALARRRGGSVQTSIRSSVAKAARSWMKAKRSSGLLPMSRCTMVFVDHHLVVDDADLEQRAMSRDPWWCRGAAASASRRVP